MERQLLHKSIRELNNMEVAHFCGIDLENGYDMALVHSLMSAALGIIKSRTGLTDVEVDKYPELTYVYFTLISEMFNTRDYTVTKDKLNPTAELILNMHSRNLVAGGADVDLK